MRIPLFMLSVVLLALAGCGPSSPQEVVVYASQDQVYAEPLLARFTQETGIPVRAVFDSEGVKTVGLANRLLAEKRLPQCDVFWSNEEFRTRDLEVQGVLRVNQPWVSFGYRSRRLVINTNRLSLALAPRSLRELTNTAWAGKVALAYPLFGTTTTHFMALRQKWGAADWLRWCTALAANRPLMVDGNSVVAKLVGRGEAWVGLTDADDIAAEQREGSPLLALALSEDSLLIPNTVSVIRDAPHPAAAQRLVEFLRSPAVVTSLVGSGALEGASVDLVPAPVLRPDWPRLVADMGAATAELTTVFLR